MNLILSILHYFEIRENSVYYFPIPTTQIIANLVLKTPQFNLRVCVLIGVDTCTHMFGHVCRDQKTTLMLLLRNVIHLILKQDLLF